MSTEDPPPAAPELVAEPAGAWGRRQILWLAVAIEVLALVLVAVTLSARFRVPGALWVLLPALLVVGTWLNWRLFRTGDSPRLPIVAIELGLLIGGAALLLATPHLALLGLSFVLLSLGMLLSEWRRIGARRTHAYVLFALCAAALGGAWLLASGLVSDSGALGRSGVVVFVLIGVGVVIGEAGIELFAAHTFDRWSVGGTGQRNRLIVGSVLVAAAVLVMVVGSGGLSWRHLGVLLVVMTLLVWMASSDGDVLALVTVAAFAVLVAGLPDEIDLPEDTQPIVDEEYFLAIGDSFMSGEGAESFVPGTNTLAVNSTATNECRRASTAWPVLLAQQPPSAVPQKVLFLACSGAVTENISTEPFLDGDRLRGATQLQLYEDAARNLGRPPEFVVLSVGGNDVGFSTIGAACVAPGSCDEVGRQVVDEFVPDKSPAFKTDLVGLRSKLDETYARVKAALPGVPVVVIPYPIPLGELGDCDVLLGADERDFVRRFVRDLDRVIEVSAAEAGFHFMDPMIDRSITPLCDDAGGPGLNFIDPDPKVGDEASALLPQNWNHNSLHPTEEGHAQMAAAARSWFDAGGFTNPPTEPDELDVTPPSWSAMYADDERAGVGADNDIEGGAGDRSPAQCKPRGEDRCLLYQQWTVSQIAEFYRAGIVPLAILTLGLLLLVNSARRRGKGLIWGPGDPGGPDAWLVTRIRGWLSSRR